MATVQIIEQPTSGVRFRYPCEARSTGCIRGASSTEKNKKTFPTIKVIDFKGPAWCVVSCVTKDGPPHHPHPHKLVGKFTNDYGVCCKKIDLSDMTCDFPQLGIQCVKKNDMKESLDKRQKVQVDPFETGYGHSTNSNKINLSCVRLCFQVIIEDASGKRIPLAPVVSNPIYDNKVVSSLAITKLSHCSASVCGGQEIILLCDQINKDDIAVLFYELENEKIIWLSPGEFSTHNVHKKSAISLTVPAYKSFKISQPIDVFIQLRRPSDGVNGTPRTFTYVPLKPDPEGLLRKTQKYNKIRNDMEVLASSSNESKVPRTYKRAVRKLQDSSIPLVKVEPDAKPEKLLAQSSIQMYEEPPRLSSPWNGSQTNELLFYEPSLVPETNLYVPQPDGLPNEFQNHSMHFVLEDQQILNNNWIPEISPNAETDSALDILAICCNDTNFEAFSEILNITSSMADA